MRIGRGTDPRTPRPRGLYVLMIRGAARSMGAGAGTMSVGPDEREQTFEQILTEIDGVNATGGVIVISATKRPEILDPALLRERGGRVFAEALG